MTEEYGLLERDAAVPEGADFCYISEGDEMEPYIREGERVYVGRCESLDELEAGLFYVRGRVVCRQWCEDYSGTLHLLCANPRRRSGNLSFSREERGDCLCLGRVLPLRRLPPPVYD